MKKSPMCYCCVCGKEFHRQAYLVKDYSEVSCSHPCRGKMLILRSIRKVEKAKEIPNLEDWLRNEYEVKKQSLREIATKILDTEKRHSAVRQFLNYYGIPIRRGSEAVKNQWAGNEGRKKKQAELALLHMGEGTPARNRLRAVQQTIEYKKRASLAKKGNKNPMYGITGEQHPQWNTARTRDQRTKERKLGTDKDWRLSVFERDSYICKVCGYDKGGILVAHHLNGYHWDIENRHNINNGITVCEPCHNDFHSKYGVKYNTKEQFDDYLKGLPVNRVQQLSILI